MDERLHAHLLGRSTARAELNTPALVLDFEALSRNISRMAAFCAESGLALRPHAKTHKSAHIARLQVEAGAVGVSCAKIGEAEALVDAGVLTDLLITSPVVPRPAIARLAALAKRTHGLMCVVDHPDNVAALGTAFHAAGARLSVLIDIDPGFHRTGISTPGAALDLLRAIEAYPSLTFKGVQFYCGPQQHIPGYSARRRALEDIRAIADAILDLLRRAGAGVDIISGGGTGTHRIDAELGLLTELQAGSYVFMDCEYLDCDLTGQGDVSPFERALTIDASVICTNTPGMVTIDAGLKALACDAGAPRVIGVRADYVFMGDEHGALYGEDGRLPALGSRVTLVAPHCDPTVNLYDTYHVVQGDMLRALWPVDARGRSR